jgi:xanthine dehydrogenase accessory factor
MNLHISPPSQLVVIRGAGEMASAVAVCLRSVGFRVVATEIERPLAIRRAVSFSDAMYAADGRASVEGVTAVRAGAVADIAPILAAGHIALLADPAGRCIATLRPLAVIDAMLAKRNLGTSMEAAPIVIALGPGFCAGHDCHAVIETQRGHDLGRILWEGAAQPDTGAPAAIQGHGADRVLRAPVAGVVAWQARIGDRVNAGQCLGMVDAEPIIAPFAGVLRGAIREGIRAEAGLKIGDVDPRGEVQAAFTISDKARAVAGAALQALLILWRRQEMERDNG